MRILAIETSCDETAAAIVQDESDGSVAIDAQVVYSQIGLHRRFGGVLPEAASREHVKKIGPVIEAAVRQVAGPTPQPQAWLRAHVDSLAVTAGPGLIGSLLVGVATAKSLAYALGKPLVGINHHEGHIMAAWLRQAGESTPLPQLPAVCLIVSGGHTKLVIMEAIRQFRELGRTRDDAAGEAFDKVARLLGLPYPGGPALSRLAAQQRTQSADNQVDLPRPLLDAASYAFSFSGLKTAVAREVARRGQLTDVDRQELARAFEDAAVDVLIAKLARAVSEFAPRSVIVAGGVAANRRLRQQLEELISRYPEVSLHIPPPELCTDNAAMIGAAALRRALLNQVGTWYDVRADEQLELAETTGIT